MSLRERFGVNLRVARLAAGLSQEKLGDRCGLHRTEVSLLERGKREPQMETTAKLAGGLRIGPGRLYDGIEWDPGAIGRPGRLVVIPAELPPPRVKRPPGRRPSR